MLVSTIEQPWLAVSDCNRHQPRPALTGTSPTTMAGPAAAALRHGAARRPSSSSPRVAGIVPVQFRRIPCQLSGGVRFCVQAGNNYWLLLYVLNVAGAGDVSDLSVKRYGDSSYVPATHN
ncbi:hypothetical protein EJB05_47112, partial [Eragrostis curvula]